VVCLLIERKRPILNTNYLRQGPSNYPFGAKVRAIIRTSAWRKMGIYGI